MSEEPQREDELDYHLTPSGVAEFMLSGDGRHVGMSYKTHGEVWDADDKRTIGLLELILLAARGQKDILADLAAEHGKRPYDPLASHANWLRNLQGAAASVLADFAKHVERIATFCDCEGLGLDVRNWDSIHDLANEYRRAFEASQWNAVNYGGKYYRSIRLAEIRDSLERLKKVKTLADIEQLKGIGPVTAKKIRAAMAADETEGGAA